MDKNAKPKIATVSLAGCFGCHMSLLDIDDKILQLVDLVDFQKSPITDIKEFTCQCKIGLIEGGCCNEENVKVLKEFRKHCDILVAVGDCATMGGIPALRNTISLKECFQKSYNEGPTTYNPSNETPSNEDIPLLLDKVYPSSDIVKIDYFLPGCPPSAEMLWNALIALLADKPLDLPCEIIKYD